MQDQRYDVVISGPAFSPRAATGCPGRGGRVVPVRVQRPDVTRQRGSQVKLAEPVHRDEFRFHAGFRADRLRGRSVRGQKHHLDDPLLAERVDGVEHKRTPARVDVQTGLLADLPARAGQRSLPRVGSATGEYPVASDRPVVTRMSPLRKTIVAQRSTTSSSALMTRPWQADVVLSYGLLYRPMPPACTAR